jgi:hypothetical protein
MGQERNASYGGVERKIPPRFGRNSRDRAAREKGGDNSDSKRNVYVVGRSKINPLQTNHGGPDFFANRLFNTISSQSKPPLWTDFDSLRCHNLGVESPNERINSDSLICLPLRYER